MGKVTSQNILDGIVVRFDDIVLFEAITPEQKERGQREINKKALDPFFKIREYLQEKFKNPKTKKDFYKKKEEYSRYNFVIRCLQEAKKGSEIVNKKGRLDAEKYVESLGFKLTDVPASISKESKITVDKFGLPFLYISQEHETEANGISLTKDAENLKKNMKKFIILHEYGHLYNFLKDYIETGEAEIVDTLSASRKDRIDSEGKANAYALENMYRKDRRELIKNSDLNNERIKKAKESLKKEDGVYNIKDDYLIGLDKFSKKKYFDY